MTHPTMDDLVAGFIARRRQIEAIEADAKVRMAPIKKEMELIETAMTKLMDEAGSLSVRTLNGTAYKQKWTKARVDDWEQTLAYIQQHDRYDLLVRQVNKTAVLDTPEPIPGVAVEHGYRIGVRTSGKEPADVA